MANHNLGGSAGGNHSEQLIGQPHRGQPTAAFSQDYPAAAAFRFATPLTQAEFFQNYPHAAAEVRSLRAAGLSPEFFQEYAQAEIGYPGDPWFPEEPAEELLRQRTDPPLPGQLSAARPPLPTEPLKVVCVGPNFRVGGVRQQALSLAKFMDPQRARISEFLVADRDAVQQSPDPGMPAPVRACDQESLASAARDCDVLLMWGNGYSQLLPGDGPLRIFVAHGETWWTRNALLESATAVDHVVAVSERVRRRVCHGFPSTTILNGVDSARLTQSCSRQQMRSRFGFHDDDFVIGSVGRLTSEKQFHLLIEAVQQLPPEFKLLLTGSGRRQSELLELANRLIPGRFVIAAAGDYLGDFYGAMDAFGLVSAHEGFGLVLAEAMLCGRPVFATDVGCVPELICDRVNGLVVRPTVDSIAAAVRLLQSRPAWARGLAAEGQALAGHHLHASRMACEYEDLFLRLHQQRLQSSDKARA